MVSPWGSEAGRDSGGRKGGAGTPGRRGFLGLRKEVPRAWTAGPLPGCTWHEVSLEIILVAPPVLGVRCGSNVSWLGREQPEPLSLAPPPPPLPQGLLPRPQALPAAPSAAQSTSVRGALRLAAPPIPGRPLGDLFPVPWPLSALPSPFRGTLSLQDFQPSSSPHGESRFPKYQANGGLRSPQHTPLRPPLHTSLPSPQLSSLPLPPDLSTPLSAFCFSLGLPLGF